MNIFPNNDHVGDIMLLIEQVSREINKMNGGGPVSDWDGHWAASALTTLQNFVRELERNEVRQHGVNMHTSDNVAELESRIQSLQGLLDEAWCRNRKEH